MRSLIVACLFLAGCGGSSAPKTEEVVSTTPEPAQAPVVNDRNSLNGVWQLVSFEQNEAGGNVSYPYGDMPIGRLTFDAAGHMSIFAMKPGRFASVNTTAGITLASVDDLRAIADGFIAYYGEFTVDDTTKTLTTKVTAGTIPSWTDSEQKRAYELSGDTLALITPATKLTWMRLLN